MDYDERIDGNEIIGRRHRRVHFHCHESRFMLTAAVRHKRIGHRVLLMPFMRVNRF